MIKVFQRVKSIRFGSSSIPMTIETRPETAQTFVTDDADNSEEMPLSNLQHAGETTLTTVANNDTPRIGS